MYQVLHDVCAKPPPTIFMVHLNLIYSYSDPPNISETRLRTAQITSRPNEGTALNFEHIFTPKTYEHC